MGIPAPHGAARARADCGHRRSPFDIWPIRREGNRRDPVYPGGPGNRQRARRRNRRAGYGGAADPGARARGDSRATTGAAHSLRITSVTTLPAYTPVVCPERRMRMNELQQYLVDEELWRYSHGWISRRDFLRRAVVLGAAAATAAAMVASVTPARRVRAASLSQGVSPFSVAEDDPSVATDWIWYHSTDGADVK